MKNDAHKALSALAWAIFSAGAALLIFGVIAYEQQNDVLTDVTQSNVGSVMVSAGWQLALLGVLLIGIDLATGAIRSYNNQARYAAPTWNPPPLPPEMQLRNQPGWTGEPRR